MRAAFSLGRHAGSLMYTSGTSLSLLDTQIGWLRWPELGPSAAPRLPGSRAPRGRQLANGSSHGDLELSCWRHRPAAWSVPAAWGSEATSVVHSRRNVPR